jgi:LuxR family transcriptional regulator, quorum-sensing system regulator BjaR1
LTNKVIRFETHQLANLLFQTVYQLKQAYELQQVFQILVSFADALNFDRIIVCSLFPHHQSEWVDEIFFVSGPWSNAENIEERETYLRRCPITRHIFEYDEAFFWTKTLNKKTGKESYRIIQNALHQDELSGIQVPIFGRTGLEGALSFAGNLSDTREDFKLTVQMVCQLAFRKILSYQPNTLTHQHRLTQREKEVLQWAAIGHKQIEIAEILKISERTVENHLRNVRKRLGVKSTAQAIASAMMSKEIEI